MSELGTQVNEQQTDMTGLGAPASVLDAQVEALLQRVAADRDRRCAQLRASTERQARELLRSARKEALANVREAITRERKQTEQALRQAQASAALEVRQREQQATRVLLEAMWAAIIGVFEARWADAARRYRRLERGASGGFGSGRGLRWGGGPQKNRVSLREFLTNTACLCSVRFSTSGTHSRSGSVARSASTTPLDLRR